jgi:hypothetical protein
MNIQNETILDPKPSYPNGYVTKDGMWAAVPFGNKFVIIHNGYQIHTANNYNTAKSYILKKIKSTSKKSSSTIGSFLK